MKRLFAVILSAVMILSIIPLSSFSADDTPLEVIVASDPQVSYLESASGPQERNSEELYNSAYGLSPVMYASRFVLEEFLERAKKSSAKAVLIAGSLANGGFDGTETEPDSEITKAEERALAERLADFSRETGKKVFVIDGERDVKAEHGRDEGINIQEFKEIWRNVTYVNAYAVDPDSCSYTADIDSNYRLIAIDAMADKTSVMAWAEAQADIADNQGKRLIGLMGASLIDHVPGFTSDKIAFGYEEIAREFARWGVKYTFTGGVCVNDVAAYSLSGYQAIYDVCTAPLTAYPATFRTVTFSKSTSLNINFIDKIKSPITVNNIDTGEPEDFDVNCIEEMKAALLSDFIAYAKDYQAAGLAAYIDDLLTVEGVREILMKKFSMRPVYYRNIFGTLDITVPAVKVIINKPLYGDGDSFAAYAAQYEADIPEGLAYETYSDALVSVIQQVVHGDEAVASTSVLGQLILNGAAVCINYALSQLDNETFLYVVDDICRRVSITLPETAQEYVSDPVNRQKVLQSVADGCAVLFDLATVDANPADTYNYTLAGYDNYRDAPVQTTVSILERIANFFNSIINFFKNLFSRFGG